MTVREAKVREGLEYCINSAACKGCPYDSIDCEEDLMRDCKRIINKKNAEIARLQRLLDEEEKNTIKIAKQMYSDGVKNGVDEFIDRLKMYKDTLNFGECGNYYRINERQLLELKIETVGERK